MKKLSYRDTAWKNIMNSYFREFIAFCIPDLYKELDWNKPLLNLDKELLSINRVHIIGQRFVDKLFKVYLINNEPLLIHVEVQAEYEKSFAERMFIYAYKIYDKYRENIISIAVLVDQNFNWRPEQYQIGYKNAVLQLKYHIIKLIDYNDYSLLRASKNLFANVILCYLEVIKIKHKSTKQQLNTKLTLIGNFYNSNYCKKDIINLYLFIDWILPLPENLELVYKNELYKLEEQKNMAYISTIERMGIEKGRQQGILQGIESGIEKGIQKGEYEILLHLFQHKFKVIPKSYEQRLKEANSEQLLFWAERLLNANTVEEIF